MSVQDAPGRDSLRIAASPTKDFFISMLIKDVALVPAIVDLVDNSLDGARRLKPGDANYKGLEIVVTAKASHFEIRDNCGGIDVETARTYAFRFGRPKGTPSTPRSVGQFGVGMKRALFKLGTAFIVESCTKTSRFSVHVNVGNWRKDESDWDFRFDNEPEVGIKVPSSDVGTTVRVQPLHPNVVEDFQSPNFSVRLAEEIEKRHSQNILRGLEISVNGKSLSTEEPTLLYSKQLKPAHERMTLPSKGSGAVRVRLYAGVALSQPADAGWYVYCNDRLLLRGDQTRTTGWGDKDSPKDVGPRIPQFHNQFAGFRGYAFLEAENAGALPWNTTKTGVEVEHPVFRSVRVRMLQMMRPVIDFLNKVKEEGEGRDRKDSGPLGRTLKAATPLKLSRVAQAGPFRYKPSKDSKPTGTASIQYSRPITQLEKVKDKLRVSTNRRGCPLAC